jgi:transcriptional regulator with XRE-family HTH domain
MDIHPLRDYRLKNGLTQTQVAEQVGASQGFVAQVELGQKSLRPKTAMRWGAALGLDPASLVFPPSA